MEKRSSAKGNAWQPAHLREEALRRSTEEYKRINPGVDDADNYVHDLKILVEKKLQMFPKGKKLIVDAVVEPISETQYRITVASTDNAEQLKQMLTKAPIWRK